MKNIFRVLHYVTNYKKEVTLNILFNLLYVFFSLFSVVMVIPFVSVLFGLLSTPKVCPQFALNKDAIIDYFSYYISYYKQTQGFFTCLIYICVAFVVFSFLSNLCRYMAMYFLAPIRNGVIKDLRNDIYKKLLILPISFFSNQRRGDLLSRMTSDLADIEWTVLTCLQMVIKDPIMIVVFSIALILANWKFVVLIILILPLPLFLIKKIGESLNRNSIKGQKKMGDLLSFAEEALSSIKVTKSLNAEKTIGDRFSSNNNLFSKISTKIIGRKELASPLTEFFSIVILTFIVVVGGTLVINKQMHPSILIAFTLIFSRIITPIQEMITAYYNFQKGDAAAKRVYEILDANERIKEKQDAEIMEGFKDKIEFKDVCFEYDNNNSFALKDINLTIHKGEKVAIVGASGAGKSTLFDLIPRFADVTKGEITIDGVNIKDINIGSLRRNIGFVSQESILFNNTILGNITFGEKDIDIEKVKQVAKISNIDEFINKLPNGYYTNIGDGGSLLSGGQKQRLCIARAIIHNPTILLLDEATSAMDTENEYLVSQAINKAMENRTLIVIAHRLSTITNSDKIIVMDKGMIVEVGTHKSLLEKENGYYSKLVKLQTI
jgi:subfamily B ATP-binding cassette protein MsbA